MKMFQFVLKKIFIWILPKSSLSRFVGWFVYLKLPKFLAQKMIKTFADFYSINLDEAEKSIEEYDSIGDLFIRKLKKGVRPIMGEPVHPSDSVIFQSGQITNFSLIQAKGRKYSLNQLIYGSKKNLKPMSETHEGGHFLTYYLCPTDYHRVHFPVSGYVTKAWHLGRKLWPVNDFSVQHIKQLYIKNERVVVEVLTPKGIVFVVMVGATNVGKIRLSYDPENLFAQKKFWKVYPQPIKVNAGEELGIFYMGSTVVVIYPKDYLNTDLTDINNKKVLMGQSILRESRGE